MVDLEQYLALRKRPPGRAAMRQSWRDLSFLHYSCDPTDLRQLIPKELEIDTFDGKAWVGLVPFHMLGIRPLWAPSVPWLSAFPETNVRTYVHRRGEQPGVWFLSLDAARWLACRIARTSFGLPYFHARMQVRRPTAGVIHYESKRPGAETDIQVRLGPTLPEPQPGSLEFFLIERYLLYSKFRGELFTGRVFHPPYPLRELEVLKCEDSLICSHGLNGGPWEHTVFSPGVNVEVFGIEPA